MSYKILLAGSLVLLALGITIAVVDAQRPPPGGRRSPAALAGTGFTYQGQLKNNGALVNGSCDFQFGLWDSLSNSTGQKSISLTVPSLSVTSGMFTTPPLDFIQGTYFDAFNGDARWLASSVRCPSGGGGYTDLSPRQALTPAPMAFALPGLYTQQNVTSTNIIGGFNGNTVDSGVWGATIGGGGKSGFINYIGGIYGTIGGGHSNTASNQYTTIGGGVSNNASGYIATVGGGSSNAATGYIAAIPGGLLNLAAGAYSFAAGNRAKAIHQGTFVWSDSQTFDFGSSGNDQFLIRAKGGVGVNTNAVSRTLEVSGTVGVSDGGIPTYYAGVATEVNSQLIDIGINEDGVNRFGGAYSSTVQGGLFRVDTRAFNALFQFWGRPAVSTTLTQIASLNNAGKFTAAGGFNGQCLSAGAFNTSGLNSCNMDVAEAFAASELTQPGDLVALVTASNGAPTVRKSDKPYDELLVGVVSQNPGLVFDNGQTHLAGDNSQLITNDKTVVALVGRVPVKVSMENGAIAMGDALTNSSHPGLAMKATRTGKIIGYALEAVERDSKVLMLVQPGYYIPPEQLDAMEHTATLEARLAALEQANSIPPTPLSKGGKGGIVDWNAAIALVIGAAGVTVIERARKK